MAIIVFVAGCGFYLFFVRPWDKHEEHMNMLQESKFRGQNLGGIDEEKKLEDDDSEHRRESAALGRGGVEQAPPEKEIK